MTARLRLALVGFGQVAAGLGADARMRRWFPRGTHADCLADHPRFDVVGIAERSVDAREAARRRFPAAAVVEDVGDLAALTPDVAVFAIAPAGRAEALAALPSVRGVLVEKPLGERSLRNRFVESCRQRRLAVQVHYWRRGEPGLAAMAAGGLAARAGRVQGAFAVYGNGLRNNGSHLLDLAQWLLGPVGAVRATGENPVQAPLPLPGDRQLAFVAEHASGTRLAAQPLDFASYREIALDLWGERGRVALTQESLAITAFPRRANRGLEGAMEIASDAPEALPARPESALPALYDNLADAIIAGAALLSPLDGAVRTEAVLDAIIESADRDGARVTVAGPE